MNFFCTLCNKKTEFEYIQDYPGSHSIFKNLKIYRCRECKTAFALPLPSGEELDDYYENVWNTSDDANIIYDIQASERANYIYKYTGDIDNPVILDIGSGHGLLFDALKKKYPDLEFYATELNPENRKRLENKGIETFRDINEIGGKKFDIICLCSVLEHLTEPYNFLTNALKFLKTGGFLFLELPDRDYIFKPVLDPHVGFYSRESLNNLAERVNLDVISISGYGREHKSLVKEFNNPNIPYRYTIQLLNELKKFFFKVKYHNHSSWEWEYNYNYLKIHDEGDSRWWIRGLFKKTD